jgi:hypothetical protein
MPFSITRFRRPGAFTGHEERVPDSLLKSTDNDTSPAADRLQPIVRV